MAFSFGNILLSDPWSLKVFCGPGDDHGADGGAWIRPSGRKQVIKRNTLFKVNWLWVREIEIPQLFPKKLVPGT